MSLSRIAVFIIGLILAIFGLYLLLGAPFDLLHAIVAVILILLGIFILLGRIPTI